jgi:hypothetical protein
MDSSPPQGDTSPCETLFSSIGIHHDDRDHIITLEIFTRDFYVLGFDLKTDRKSVEEHIKLTVNEM